MAEIINLRMARKARNRAQATQQANENRAKFGRTKSQKAAERVESERAVRVIEGLRRDPDGNNG
jgi:hypothetical protein